MSFLALKNLFFWEVLLRSLIVVTPLGMSRAKLRVRLKWPNMYPCFAWSCMILLFVCLFIFDEMCMIFWFMVFCCVYCLLKSFPNCYSVCHPNNMYAPLSITCGGSKHGSSVFIRFGYLVANSPTHSLKSLDHFLLTVKDKPCRLDQRKVHYITSWEV